MAQGDGFVLQSSDSKVSAIKQRLLGAALEDMVKAPLAGQTKSLNEVIVQGLVELCREKPVGLDAVKWLGDWMLANNPAKPCVLDEDDQ